MSSAGSSARPCDERAGGPIRIFRNRPRCVAVNAYPLLIVGLVSRRLDGAHRYGNCVSIRSQRELTLALIIERFGHRVRMPI